MVIPAGVLIRQSPEIQLHTSEVQARLKMDTTKNYICDLLGGGFFLKKKRISGLLTIIEGEKPRVKRASG